MSACGAMGPPFTLFVICFRNMRPPARAHTHPVANPQRSILVLILIGMTVLDQLGLMDMSDLLELSKGLSKIGAKIFEGLWCKLRTSKSPFSFLDKQGSAAGHFGMGIPA